jgi:hypothetical protein
MAPELALDTLNDLRPTSLVLDPMSGSGTVLRQASELGLRSLGFDLDPLAVLMSRVWNTPVDDSTIADVSSQVMDETHSLLGKSVILPWIDGDPETVEFAKFWFGRKQRDVLRRVAFAIDACGKRRWGGEKNAALDVVRVALSRTIVTKEQGASLARDTSHSRPHKVSTSSEYDVIDGLERSLRQVRKRLREHPPWGGAEVRVGDARGLKGVARGSVDAVLTSPPYLNAIDYLRGHRLSLIWLGHSLSTLRAIRASSIGAERAPDCKKVSEIHDQLARAMCGGALLSPRHAAMVQRYCADIFLMMSEIARVTKTSGFATLVVGNSCLKGNFIKNSAGISTAASLLDMQLIASKERDLPMSSRYLPVTTTGTLAGRMRTESVMTFRRQ